MRFIEYPDIQLLYKKTDIVLHIDNRDRGDILKQVRKINDLGGEYTLEIKKKRTAGEKPIESFIWALIHKIAEHKNQDPIQIYIELLSNNAEQFIIYTSPKSFPAFKEEWEGRGHGYKIVRSLDYKEYMKCTCIKGLSGMNDAELHKFAEDVKNECRYLGIYAEG